MLWIGAVVCAVAAMAQGPQADYRARREAVRKTLTDGVLVLFGEAAAQQEQFRNGFWPEENFLYLTGWREPGAILLMTPASDTLFLPKHNAARERYTGLRESADDANAREATGFQQVMPVAQFEAQLSKALESSARIYTLTAQPWAAKLKDLAPLREVVNAAPMLDRQRLKKSTAELAAIERATDVSVEAHRAAWRRIAPGVFEYQVAAVMTFTMLERGCEGNAYPPIVGSGPNATVLHYDKNEREIQAGDLVLMDVGAECGGYASDITRTAPATGRFTERQRELYGVVLGANKAGIAAVRPGVTMQELNKVVRDYIGGHGKDRSGNSLVKYLTHRVSHGVGLDVHDPPDAGLTAPLEAGMVITIEPGLYIPEENIGIRIEDTVLITESGARVLSGALPKEVGEIERVMGEAKGSDCSAHEGQRSLTPLQR